MQERRPYYMDEGQSLRFALLLLGIGMAFGFVAGTVAASLGWALL